MLLIAVFLEPIDNEQPKKGGEKAPAVWSTLLSTIGLFRDRRLCLLSLLPLYSGLQQGFLSGEYTRVGAELGPQGWAQTAAQGSCHRPPALAGLPIQDAHFGEPLDSHKPLISLGCHLA